MRFAAFALMTAAVLALSVGCASHRDQRVSAQRSSPELVSRYEAASAITDVATRDQALAQVAWLGAEAGDGRIVLQCVSAMSVSPVRDSTAYQCSVRLAEDGWVPQATAAAKTIGDQAIRDRALSKVAQSSVYPIAPP